MKIIINYVLSIILAILIVAFFFVNLATNTVINEQYIFSKLEKEDYYNKIYQKIENNFENYIHQSGFEENVLENIVTKQKIQEDTKIIIENIYENKNQEIDVTEIKVKLQNNINNSLNGMRINDNQKEAINTFIEHICKEYKTTISYFDFEAKIGISFVKILDFINFIKKFLLVSISIDFLLLLMINLKGIYKLFMQVGFSLAVNGFIMLFINVFINSKIKIKNILILNSVISQVLRNTINEVLNNVLKFGVITLVLGFLLIAISNLVHNAKKNKTNEL